MSETIQGALVTSTVDNISTDMSAPKDLSPAQIEHYKKISKSLVPTDRSSVLNYGSELHTVMDQNSHQMLKVARATEGNEITKMTAELRNKLDMVNPGELQQSTWKSVLRKIPVLNLFVPSVQQLLNKYDTVAENVDAISKQILSIALMSKKDNSEIEIMRQNNIQYIHQTDELINAALLKSEELKNQVYEMQEHPDKYESYEVAQVSGFVEALDRKIYNMRQSRFAMTLAITELDITQNNNLLVAETAENFVRDVIPQWRNQLSISLIMDNNRKRLDALKQSKEFNEEILINNAKMMRQNAIETAKQAQGGIYNVQTLEEATKIIYETIDKLDDIQRKGAEEMKEGTEKMQALVGKLAETQERIHTASEKNYIGGATQTFKELEA